MVKCAMIMAAGQGMRMRPLTLKRPKPLCELMGKPLIYQALQNCKLLGAQEVLINTHYLPAQLEKRLGRSFLGMTLHYQHELSVLGTGGALLMARDFFRRFEGPYIVANADTPVQLNVQTFLEKAGERDFDALMVVKKIDSKDDSDLRWSSARRITAFSKHGKSKPKNTDSGKYCGTQLMTPYVLQNLPHLPNFCFIKDYYVPSVEKLNLRSLETEGQFVDISTAEELWEVNMKCLEDLSKSIKVNSEYCELEKGVFVEQGVKLPEEVKFQGPVLICNGANVEKGSVIGPFVILGECTKVGRDAKLERAVVFSKSTIAPGSSVKNGIVCDDMTLTF